MAEIGLRGSTSTDGIYVHTGYYDKCRQGVWLRENGQWYSLIAKSYDFNPAAEWVAKSVTDYDCSGLHRIGDLPTRPPVTRADGYYLTKIDGMHEVWQRLEGKWHALNEDEGVWTPWPMVTDELGTGEGDSITPLSDVEVG